MWRYLRAAFLVRVEVPGLGRVPVNVLAVVGAAIVGAVEPSILLAGAGLEVAFVSALAFQPRFQRLTDGVEGTRRLTDEAAQVSALVAGLPEELTRRLTGLQKSSARVLAIYRTLGFEAVQTESTRLGLDRLEWVYLKLLVARNHLTNELGQETEAELAGKIARLEASADAGMEAVRDEGALARSQEATLGLLRRRAENLRSRDRLLRENESDLTRIETQVDVMRENAAIEGKPAAVETEIELASDLASPDAFGLHQGLVHALERRRAT